MLRNMVKVGILLVLLFVLVVEVAVASQTLWIPLPTYGTEFTNEKVAKRAYDAVKAAKLLGVDLDVEIIPTFPEFAGRLNSALSAGKELVAIIPDALLTYYASQGLLTTLASIEHPAEEVSYEDEVLGYRAFVPDWLVIISASTENVHLLTQVALKFAAEKLAPSEETDLKAELNSKLNSLAAAIATTLSEKYYLYDIIRDRMVHECSQGNTEGILSEYQFAEVLGVLEETQKVQETLWNLRILPVLDLYLPVEEQRERCLKDEGQGPTLVAGCSPFLENDDKALLAFNLEGTEVYLDAKEPPDSSENILVVAPCEHGTHYTPVEEYTPDEENDGFGSIFLIPASYSLAANAFPALHLWLLRIPNKAALGELESWWKGRPELYTHVLSGSGSGRTWITQWFLSYKRGYTGKKWKTYNRRLLFWNPAVWGNNIKFVWGESDSGKTMTISIKYKGVNFSLSVHDGDDEGGSCIVPRGFISPTDYATGKIEFRLTK